MFDLEIHFNLQRVDAIRLAVSTAALWLIEFSNSFCVAGILAGYSSIVYSAAKAAVIHLTRVVAMELGESNVRVNCISPGGIATGISGKGAGTPPIKKAVRITDGFFIFTLPTM